MNYKGCELGKLGRHKEVAELAGRDESTEATVDDTPALTRYAAEHANDSELPASISELIAAWYQLHHQQQLCEGASAENVDSDDGEE